MPPRGKKTKAEEALDFLSNLDNLDAPPSGSEVTSEENAAPAPASGSLPSATAGSSAAIASQDTPRGSSEGSRKSLSASRELQPAAQAAQAQDDEAASALAFLEAQINQKRAPLSKPKSGVLTGPGAGLGANASASGTPRSSTPQPQAQAPEPTPSNVPSSPPSTSTGGGWGSSFWSSATSALQQAQRVADEQYKKVRTEGVSGVTGQLEHLGVGVKGVAGVAGVDLNKLRKGAEERLGGIVKGVDLEKLRQDLLNTTTSTLTSILDTVAPPISAHQTLELWLSHPMVGYAGVEGVVYRAWTRILEQTESGELIVVWSAPTSTSEKEGEGEKEDERRSINPSSGWTEGWNTTGKEIEEIKKREEANPQGRARANASVPVTTVPIFLYLQPVLAPLAIPEPPILLSSSTSNTTTPPNHLHFILTLQDPSHSLRFTTVSQSIPADWLDVEYERSEWVEERLVEVLRTSVEVVAQDYVATRMGLKPSAAAVIQSALEATQDSAAPAAPTSEGEAADTTKAE